MADLIIGSAPHFETTFLSHKFVFRLVDGRFVHQFTVEPTYIQHCPNIRDSSITVNSESEIENRTISTTDTAGFSAILSKNVSMLTSLNARQNTSTSASHPWLLDVSVAVGDVYVSKHLGNSVI